MNRNSETNIIQILDFKFNTLHKFMQPFYADLNLHDSEPIEIKRKRLRQIIPQFFIRLRHYRDCTIEDIAIHSGLSLKTLIQFEAGHNTPQTGEIEQAYIEKCYAQSEFLYFKDFLNEFLNPSIKERKKEMAFEALEKFGILFRTVNYKKLVREEAQICQFTRSEHFDDSSNSTGK